MWHNSKSGFGKRMKGMAKAVLALSMCLAMPFATLTAAAESVEMVDPDAKGSLSITFTYEGEPISNGNEVGIYKVADVVADDGYKFKLRDEFASVGELPDTTAELEAANADLAREMEEIAKDNGVAQYQSSQALDSDGNVQFDDLEVGLYLVVHTKKTEFTRPDKTKVTYTINPFLISIPQNKDGKLVYDVATNPKVSPEKAQVPPPKPPHIPQTGQLWWPVMALGCAGALLLVFGMVRRIKDI